MNTHSAFCADCGFDRAYDSGAKAAYALKRHSCERQLARAMSHSRRLEREAAIDRTPKSCRHKLAEHQHGTNAAYILDRCRCLSCARAHSAQEMWRERQKAYGRYDRYVEAKPVREHVDKLLASSMGLKRIAATSGVAHGSLSKLIYGKRRPDGTYRRSARVLRTTADRLLATNPDLADGAHIPAYGTATRLRALVAIGYSIAYLGRRLGIDRGNMRHPMDPDGFVTAGTARAAAELYKELSMTPAVGMDQRSRASVTRARKFAEERGWLPPLELDDGQLDDPAYQPDPVDERDLEFDEVAIMRRQQGDRSVRLTKAEALELVRRWRASGRPLNECERLTGLNARRYLREAA